MNEDIEAFWLERRQGDVLTLANLLVGAAGDPIAAPHGVAIISQTCDLVRLNGKPNVLVALIVELGDPRAATAAREGERPRYVHLPALGDSAFIDLDFVQTFEKAPHVGSFRAPGVEPLDFKVVRRLALAIGRRFSRLALPDEVVPWFDPLSAIAEKQYDKPNSPIGRALGAIQEFRVQAPHWDPPGVSVTLHIILKESELQEFDENEVVSDALRAWFDLKPRTHSDIAEKLFPAVDIRPRGADRDQLWAWLGTTLAAKCSVKIPGEVPAVKEVVAMVSNETEFNLVRYRKSDQLDLAHLSAPTPHLDEG